MLCGPLERIPEQRGEKDIRETEESQIKYNLTLMIITH